MRTATTRAALLAFAASLPAAVTAMDTPVIDTAADRERLARLPEAWEAGLAAARRAAPAAIAAQGALFVPDRVLPDAMPPAGDYRCRVFKLGARSRGPLDYVAYPAFPCRIAAGSLEKTGGSQRFLGTLRAGRDDRVTFLGTLRYGDEGRFLAYGRDRQRDMAGRIERVAANRWRLALPFPAFESLIDVVELVPAG